MKFRKLKKLKEFRIYFSSFDTADDEFYNGYVEKSGDELEIHSQWEYDNGLYTESGWNVPESVKWKDIKNNLLDKYNGPRMWLQTNPFKCRHCGKNLFYKPKEDYFYDWEICDACYDKMIEKMEQECNEDAQAKALTCELCDHNQGGWCTIEGDACYDDDPACGSFSNPDFDETDFEDEEYDNDKQN